MFIFLFISRWSHPSKINGVLEFYLIFLSHDSGEPVLAYNSSEVFEDYTLRSLTPGTLYTITVAVSPLRLNFDFQFVNLYHHIHSYVIVYVCACVCVCVCVCEWQACTGGGCTLSPPSQAQTEESTPENVPAPLVTPLSPNALNVSWTPPDTPNGERVHTYTKIQTIDFLK